MSRDWQPFSMLEELTKLCAGEVTEGEARAALGRLQKLEAEKPTASQLTRGAAAGAIAAPGVTLIREAVGGGLGKGISEAWKRPGVGGKLTGLGIGAAKGLRASAAASAGTAAAFGGIPVIRNYLDREAEKEKLRNYLGVSQRGRFGRTVKKYVGV